MSRENFSGKELPVHPIALFGMTLTWVNDHHLKDWFGNGITGKLSDFAGLLFFPFWLLGVVELLTWVFGSPRRARPVHALWVAMVMAVAFSAIKTLPIAADGYRWGMAQLLGLVKGRDSSLVAIRFTRDPTDLIALPALLVCYFVLRGRNVPYWGPPTFPRRRCGAIRRQTERAVVCFKNSLHATTERE